jgi:hypothetical protein
MTFQSDRGVLYVASGQPYVTAAIRSARSVAAHAPGLPAFIYHDAATRPLVEAAGNVFSGAALIENPHYRSKVDYLPRSPFERTLYLDSDTEICGPILDIFDVLDRFDIALSHAQRRWRKDTTENWREEIPFCFPQFNGGVLAAHLGRPPVRQLLEDWRTAFHQANFKKDQVTLRELLWRSDLRIATLPPEYNTRFKKYLLLWSRDEARPLILHYREFHKDWPDWRWRISPSMLLTWWAKRRLGLPLK